MAIGVYERTERSRNNGAKTRFPKNNVPWNKGKKMEYKARPTRKGRPTWSKGLKGVLKPNSGSFGHGRSTKPEDHPRWKGGVTPINVTIRHSIEYRLWRESVFARDGYKCIWCGAKNGNGKRIVLNADHIKPFAYFPELRFAIDNGRTLCESCHRTTETYGTKAWRKV